MFYADYTRKFPDNVVKYQDIVLFVHKRIFFLSKEGKNRERRNAVNRGHYILPSLGTLFGPIGVT